jgi:hypothetical protein
MQIGDYHIGRSCRLRKASQRVEVEEEEEEEEDADERESKENEELEPLKKLGVEQSRESVNMAEALTGTKEKLGEREAAVGEKTEL